MTMSAGLKARLIRLGTGRSPQSQLFGSQTSLKAPPNTPEDDATQAQDDNRVVIETKGRRLQMKTSQDPKMDYTKATEENYEKSGVISGLPSTFSFTKGFRLPQPNDSSNKENLPPLSNMTASRKKGAKLGPNFDQDKGGTKKLEQEHIITSTNDFEFKGEGTRESPIIVTPDPPNTPSQFPKRPPPPPLLTEAINYMAGFYVDEISSSKSRSQSPVQQPGSKWSDDSESAQSAVEKTKDMPKQVNQSVIEILSSLRELQALLKDTIPIKTIEGST